MILFLAILFNGIQASMEALFERFMPGVTDVINKIHGLVIFAFFINWFFVIHLFGAEYIPLWKLICGFFFVRFLMYDTVWNLTIIATGVKIPIYYYGFTKLYDRIMTSLASFGWFAKFVLGIIGICFLMGWN